MDYLLQDFFSRMSQMYDMMRIVSIFMWIGSSIVIGFYAMNKGYSWVGWFFISLFLSPLLGAILSAGLQDKSVDEDERVVKELNKIYEKMSELLASNKEVMKAIEKNKVVRLDKIEVGGEGENTEVAGTESVDTESVEELRKLFEKTSDPNVKKECAEKLVQKGYLYFNRYLQSLEK